jgi:hypothetical protein
MEQAEESIKKCPNCGQWSRWKNQVDNRCEYCDALLDPEGYRRVQDRDQRETEEDARAFKIKLIEIRPEDHPVIRFFKYIIRGGQIVFMGILSFFIWFITVVAG